MTFLGCIGQCRYFFAIMNWQLNKGIYRFCTRLMHICNIIDSTGKCNAVNRFIQTTDERTAANCSFLFKMNLLRVREELGGGSLMYHSTADVWLSILLHQLSPALNNEPQRNPALVNILACPIRFECLNSEPAFFFLFGFLFGYISISVNN